MFYKQLDFILFVEFEWKLLILKMNAKVKF